MPGALLPMSANTPPKNPPNWGAMLAKSPLLPLMIPTSSPIQPFAIPVIPLKVGIRVAEKVPINPWTLPLSPAISSPQASSPSTASSDMTAPFLWASSVRAANSSLLAPIRGISSWYDLPKRFCAVISRSVAFSICPRAWIASKYTSRESLSWPLTSRTLTPNFAMSSACCPVPLMAPSIAFVNLPKLLVMVSIPTPTWSPTYCSSCRVVNESPVFKLISTSSPAASELFIAIAVSPPTAPTAAAPTPAITFPTPARADPTPLPRSFSCSPKLLTSFSDFLLSSPVFLVSSPTSFSLSGMSVSSFSNFPNVAVAL